MNAGSIPARTSSGLIARRAAPAVQRRRDRRALWFAISVAAHVAVVAVLIVFAGQPRTPPDAVTPAEVALVFSGGAPNAAPTPPAERANPSAAPAPIPGPDTETTPPPAAPPSAAPPPATPPPAPPVPAPPVPAPEPLPEMSATPAPPPSTTAGELPLPPAAPAPTATALLPPEPLVQASPAPAASLPPQDATAGPGPALPVPPPLPLEVPGAPPPPALAAGEPRPSPPARPIRPRPPASPRVAGRPRPRLSPDGFPLTLAPSFDLSRTNHAQQNAAAPSANRFAANNSLVNDVQAPRELGADYLAAFSYYVNARKKYPEGAAENGQEGDTTISVVVNRDGHVNATGIDLLSGSGSSLLDDELKSIFRSKRDLPKFPASEPNDQETITVTMHYYLIR